jgi:hypothetical protein
VFEAVSANFNLLGGYLTEDPHKQDKCYNNCMFYQLLRLDVLVDMEKVFRVVLGFYFL